MIDNPSFQYKRMKIKIGHRIKAERERKKISQETLAKAVGWNSHQIVSMVEQEKREVKSWELYEIAKFLSVDIDILLGNKELSEQPYVLWREKPEEEKLLEARFLSECDNYLWIEQLVSGAKESPILVFEELPQKTINLQQFTLENAYQLAEDIRQRMSLGDFPAVQLLGVLQDRYGVKFIVNQEEMKPSAACSRSKKGCFVFINGCHAEPRQYFSIAHELFHLITWDPKMLKIVDRDPKMHEKNEKLANAFAAGLLIPREKILAEFTKIFNAERAITASDIIALAEQFQVSKEAMLYRMKNVNLINDEKLNEIKKRLLTVRTAKTDNPTIADSLMSKFVRLVYLACEHVKISRAKAAKLLNIDLCDLSSLFNKYGFIEVNV